MNKTITIDGKDYEVLTLGKHSSMTHVLFAGGTVKEADTCTDQGKGFWVFADSPDNPNGDRYSVETARLHNIQPLKLIERKPVEVIGKFTGVEVYAEYEVAQFMVPLGTGRLIGRKMDMKLVQITEEA